MYLRLKFRNAKLFRTNRMTKDKNFELVDYEKNKYKGVSRSEITQYKEPITKYQISNMLHVLLGERPVPKNRNVPYQRLKYIDDLADRSFLNLKTTKRYSKNSGGYITYPEGINDKRALWNSWNPSSYTHTWRTLYLYCNNKKINPGLYETVISEIEKAIGNKIGNETFYEVVELIRKINSQKMNVFFKFLKESKLSKIKDYIEKGKKANMTAYGGRVSITNNKSLSSFEGYSGEILVPVDEEICNKFNSSSGSATILDGGYVYIDKVLQDEEISLEYFEDNFKEVKSIPTTEY